MTELWTSWTYVDLVLALGAAVLVVGLVGHLLVTDLLRRVVALNVASGGVMMVLLALAARSEEPDPVPQALVLTGIVIMAAATGLAVALVRRVESVGDEEETP
ncbi:NADH-quinone oxidoreductase subunit K [Nocardioides massiliensis]|uniref:Multicomponent Na+:H+ antiporter subunit C n=1 Tax=Nocardioides massiliensis TaxID=1325935 RepID=A0ABT9NQM9_9ACTN|nr:NADH-quinone oxidoreductase subunit K [Nocardioides massiliensis]MDP9822688.1 multicomponent Na+:H+ antiporter subunit C [Nocardioides massiliensis]